MIIKNRASFQSRFENKSWLEQVFAFGFLAVLLLFNAYFLNINMFRCFNFIDMGSILDASYRIYIGQRPYVDFIYWPSPLYLYINAFFFVVFGFGKTAMLAHLLVVHSIVIIVVFFLLYRRVPLLGTILGTTLTVPSFYWSISFPWHDQNAHLWGILGIALLLKSSPFKSSRAAWGAGLFCGFMTALAFFTKMNLGGIYGLFFITFFILSKFRKQALMGFIFGGGLGILSMGVLLGFPKEYFVQFRQLIGTEGERRLFLLLDPLRWLVNYYYLPVLVVLIGCFPRYEQIKEGLLLFLGVSVIGVFSCITGGMMPMANNIMWGIQAALGMICLWQVREKFQNEEKWLYRKVRQLAWCWMLLFVFLLCLISVDYGSKLLVWHYIRHDPIGNYAIKTKPLDGWMALNGHGEILDGMASYVGKFVPKDHSLLILTRHTVLYALTGHEPYRGVPYLFLDGVLPAQGEQVRQVGDRILGNPPDWIIVDVTQFKEVLVDLGIRQMVSDDYLPVEQWKTTVLLIRRDIYAEALKDYAVRMGAASP